MMEPNIVKDRFICSPIENDWTPEDLEGGSLYNDLKKKVQKNIKDGGDWLWLHDRITGKKMMASEFEVLSKKFAVIFNSLGLGKGTYFSQML